MEKMDLSIVEQIQVTSAKKAYMELLTSQVRFVGFEDLFDQVGSHLLLWGFQRQWLLQYYRNINDGNGGSSEMGCI